MLLLGGSVFAAPPAGSAAAAAENREFEILRRSAEQIAIQLNGLRRSLEKSHEKNREQASKINRLQDELAAVYARDLAQERAAFFARLGAELPLSPVYRVRGDRVIVANDPVFIFGKGEVGAEGRERLQPLVAALARSVRALPAEGWRLRVEGHTDRRPIRSNRRFSDNWGLSTARALSVLRILAAAGIADRHLEAVGLAATRLRDSATGGAAHRRNRRIEIHLVPGGS